MFLLTGFEGSSCLAYVRPRVVCTADLVHHISLFICFNSVWVMVNVVVVFVEV